ncbi:MAG: regulatory protein [Marivirga sp.]|jgi:regulatory protein
MSDTPTIKAVKLKAVKFCAYQERTQQQLRDKLYQWGLYGDDVEEVIAFAISERFINEERFAQSYASGHFRLKKWGKLKIKNGLGQKGLSNYCIEKGMAEINQAEYISTIEQLLAQKYRLLKDKEKYIKKQKAVRHLIQKGYESELVWSKANELFQ